MALISLGYITMMHFGTPCQRMTFARPSQFRSADHVWGHPGINPKQSALANLGNALAMVTVRCCFALYNMSAYLNPYGSWLWRLPPILELYAMRGAIFTEVMLFLLWCALDNTDWASS